MSFIDIVRVPDSVQIVTEDARRPLEQVQPTEWSTAGCTACTEPADGGLHVTLRSPRGEAAWVRLRWQGTLPTGIRLLGDHWERGYGDLEWRGLVPERPMPWYFLALDGTVTHGYGVMTGAGAMCFWTVDPVGISLWMDVRCGGVPVVPGGRTIEAATVVARPGEKDESPFEAARGLCRALCPEPRMTDLPAYGSNNWYYAYGRTSHEQILVDAELVSRLAPDGNRPFMVIDSGWQPKGGQAGPTLETNEQFPDMPRLAEEIRERGARPGIWTRPLLTRGEEPETWRLPPGRFAARDLPVLDPTVPEAAERIARHVRGLADWGYGLIKHDFTTYDLLARWGYRMGPYVTAGGWSFADRSRTTAEVITDLYRLLREAAGQEALLLGCNTVGHLGAGIFELQRTGDDTSGRDWERTRKMGVNTLAFRMPQQGAFFDCDADCVGLGERVPWRLNRQWLDLLARSGTALFVSADPDALGPEQEAALRAAFTVAARRQPPGEPLDWLETTCPRKWKLDGEHAEFDWMPAGGADPLGG